jgi:hypothetical protein
MKLFPIFRYPRNTTSLVTPSLVAAALNWIWPLPPLFQNPARPVMLLELAILQI